MAKQLFTNAARTLLNGSLTQGGTTLIVSTGEGSKFPAPTGGDYFLLTLFQKDLSNNEVRTEVVRCTARTGDTLTITRDEEDMTGNAGGYAYPENPGDDVHIELRLTAAGAENFLQVSDLGSGADQAAPGNHTHSYGDASSSVSASVDGEIVVFDGTGGKTVKRATGLTGLTKLTAGVVSVATADTDYVTPTGTVTLTNKTLTDPTVTQFTETRYAPSSGTSFTLDLANGTVQRFSTSGNITITLPSSASGKSYVVEISYGGTHTVTFSGGGTLKWAGGAAPTATSVNGKMDRYVFSCDGTNTLGSDGGRNF